MASSHLSALALQKPITDIKCEPNSAKNLFQSENNIFRKIL